MEHDEDGAIVRRSAPERVLFALQQRKSGKGYADTVSAIVERFGVVERTAARDVAEARDRMVEQLRERVPFLADELLGKLFGVYEAACTGGDGEDGAWPNYNAAVAALREAGKLAGAYAAERVTVTHEYTDAELEETLAELRANAVAETSTETLLAELRSRGLMLPETAEAETVQ